MWLIASGVAIVAFVIAFHTATAFEEWFQSYPRIDQPGGE
jgi:hypothetical protein